MGKRKHRRDRPRPPPKRGTMPVEEPLVAGSTAQAPARIRLGPFLLRFVVALTALFLLWLLVAPYYSVATLWPLTWLFPLLLGVTINLNLSAVPGNLWE